MTGGDDDIAAALPRPPFPAPARREAAIAEAMRRFDGGEEPSAAGPGERFESGPAPWRTRFNRPQAGALAGAFLVALIALPLAWSSLPDRTLDGGRDKRAEPPGGAMRSGNPDASSVSTQSHRDPAPPESGEPGSPSAVADAAADPAARADVAPPPAPMTDETALGDNGEVAVTGIQIPPANEPSSTPVTAVGGDEVVVTGSRIPRPHLESAVPITSIGGEEFFQTGAAARRGDWNACTVDDPKRDPSACRRDVASVARGASGRASAHLAEGLARAWEGELDKAVGAFDRAIALAPRSSAAYLNRGLARHRLGDAARARADLDKAILYAPQSARGYYHRSLLLRERGDARRARADEERAIALDPRYAAVVRAARKQAR
ncbi:MAG TPA: tetratricopeptide repeat protein [Allosphingosinicella sp.]|nr:tetratricopeptide repeat protein [Allosphingosinicella sp.]